MQTNDVIHAIFIDKQGCIICRLELYISELKYHTIQLGYILSMLFPKASTITSCKLVLGISYSA